MKINWGRVLNAGLISEILLIGVYQIVAALYGHGNAAIITVIAGAFVFMMVGALWVGRKIESRFVGRCPTLSEPPSLKRFFS
jgi:hypothetical protein